MQRCYCGALRSAALQHQQHCLPHQQQQQQLSRPRGDLMSVTSSSRQSLRPTQFVRRPSLKSAPRFGLGHSSTGLGHDFSRRNSAATTASLSHCSSCSCSSAQQRQQSRAKVLRWGWEQTGGVDAGSPQNYAQFTDNRRLYEQSACVASRRQVLEGQGQVYSASSSSTPPRPVYSPSHKTIADELQQLRSLQQFRLSNASECFSEGRQDELRLQQAYDRLSATNTDKWNKNRANESRQQQQRHHQEVPCSSGTTTPYALRQRLLQLRLQAEEREGRGTGATCAPLEKSCALRYNS
ncbi:hypothetical protein KR018_010921 [Drosophila ironensis]|nr:hypothetical protein KR018_010921 [Drosophila ironensis]